jgi:peptidyl-prolyl cis-trans isomerase-like 4
VYTKHSLQVCRARHMRARFCRNEEEIEAEVETQKAKNRKILLEMIGDRPDADAKAPDEFLFVCKLNPITNEEDLETIFSRFGEVIACDIIRDKKTGDSLNYAFIGFSEKKSAEEAYLKMNNALIDDRCVLISLVCSVCSFFRAAHLDS